MRRPEHLLLTLPVALALALTPALAGSSVAQAQEFPQFTVTFTDGDAHPLPGERYVYRASVRNTGTETVRGARLQAVVPSQVRLLPQSVRTDAGQVTIGNVFGEISNLVSIELGAVDPGERLQASWTVVLRKDAGPTFPAAVTAERTADDGFADTIAGVYDLATEPATAVDATLTGPQVSPGPGDRDGTGSARLRVVPATGQVCSVLTVRRIALPALRATVTSAAGTVQLPAPDATGSARGCTVADPAVVRAVVSGGAVLRVDNAAFPAGAVAGPLTGPAAA